MTRFVVTPVIKEALEKALQNPKLPETKRTELHSYKTQEDIPLETLKEITVLLEDVYLHELLLGSKIFVPPKPKPVIVCAAAMPLTVRQDPEREAHKQKLRRLAEDKAYFSMVKDITVENPLVAQKEKVEMKNALKDAAIPINMVLTAAGAFAFGYYFVDWMTHSFYKVHSREPG